MEYSSLRSFFNFSWTTKLTKKLTGNASVSTKWLKRCQNRERNVELLQRNPQDWIGAVFSNTKMLIVLLKKLR